ncbi:MAG: hypothetical protein ABW185_17440 [Sedimenticola sp.]
MKAKDIGSDNRISELMRYFERERPVSQSIAPKWNLTCVLFALSEKPYEPMEEASRLDWSIKTAFLLAFASAKRSSELHALAADGFFFDEFGKMMTLAYDINFLPKTHHSGSLPKPFQIPSLLGQENADISLCPVRAMKYYLEISASSRRNRRKLFIPVVGEGEVSKASISRWIALAIRKAYQGMSNRKLSMLKINAHEVRAMSTSWAFFNHASLTNIMDAACWKSHSTFSKFYLRSMSVQSHDLYKLGPLVAASQIVKK